MGNSLGALALAVSTELGDLASGTATGGTATTLIDTSSDSPFTGADGAGLFDEHWCAIVGGTNDGSERRVSGYDPATRTVTFADAFPAFVDATSRYELRRLARRSDVTAAINRALTRRLFFRTVEPTGLLADGDGAFQDADTAKWTGSNATLTKESSENDFLAIGQRSLRLDALAGGAYAASQAILVRPAETIRVVALCLPWLVGAAKSSASLVVWDQDNNAAVPLSGVSTADYTTDGPRWKWLDVTAAVPGGCGRITVRPTEATNGARAFWGWVAAVRPAQRYYTLPGWCDGEEALEWLWSHDDMNPTEPYERRLRKVTAQTYFHERPGSGFPEVEIPGLAGRIVFASGYRYYGSLAADADSTNAPLLWLLAASLVELLEPLAGHPDERDRARLGERLAYWQSELKQRSGDAAPDVVVPLRLSGR